LADPQQAKGAIIDCPAAAGPHTKDVPHSFIGLLVAGNFASIFRQARVGRAQERLTDDVAVALLLKGELDGCRQLRAIGRKIADVLGFAVVA
jgi:hypothetical protein